MEIQDILNKNALFNSLNGIYSGHIYVKTMQYQVKRPPKLRRTEWRHMPYTSSVLNGVILHCYTCVRHAKVNQ